MVLQRRRFSPMVSAAVASASVWKNSAHITAVHRWFTTFYCLQDVSNTSLMISSSMSSRCTITVIVSISAGSWSVELFFVAVIAVQQILRAWGEETPSLQQNWNANGSSNLLDPCGAQWVGVSCSPSAVQSQHADYSSITSLYYVFYYTLEHLYMHCCCSFASNNTESTAT
jgi:hypothetical protein